MDFLDNLRLIRTTHLNNVLEGLCCNEDSNAKDSIFSKSTTLDNEDCYRCENAIFGESNECTKKMINLGRIDADDRDSVWDLGWNDSDEEHCNKYIFAKITSRWNL